MTAQLFEEYVHHQLDCRFAAKKRSLLIVLDNASVHVDVGNLSAIKLLLSPPNTTALAQPFDQSIFRSVTQIYRKNLLRRMLIAMESDKTYRIDFLGAIHLLIDASTICNDAELYRASTVQDPEGGIGEKEDGEDTEDCESLLVEVRKWQKTQRCHV
ncbi:hypothetical protein HPB51_013150 [Rhipicephalus microplus]|uniref:DDE-1 domain-containing protein n=1 Tax=Rhipicephalus microplus TaxID=6941 RepID=A0A9J6E0M7_RHIMP|nr:hypothetical protein HPB51_013150 [Rhipicephalus microplus]